MENDDLLIFSTDIAGHRCTASLTAAANGNRHLAILLLTYPQFGAWSRIEQRVFEAWKLLAIRWATDLTGITPLVMEPWHTSGHTRRRSHE